MANLVQAYTWSTRIAPETCENEVVDLLKKMRQRMRSYDDDPDAAFNVEQNALVMVDVEQYYRAMVRSDENSWSVRDVYMVDTLDRFMSSTGRMRKPLSGRTALGVCKGHETQV